MGATGIVDNAGSGSLWSTIAHERYYRHAYTTTAERIAAVGNWMQSTRERLRSAIGMLPTIDYEQTPMVNPEAS